MGSIGYKRAVLAAISLLAAGLVAISSPSPASAAAWRAFAPSSPWNVPAAQKGGLAPSNPFASQFTSYSSSLEISGVAPDNKWGKPIFFAKPGDPEYRWTDQNGWAKGDIRYQGEPIPMPAGAHEATGSDGHLTIVTADRRYEYDMWRADVSKRAADTIVRFDLTGAGVPADRRRQHLRAGLGHAAHPDHDPGRGGAHRDRPRARADRSERRRQLRLPGDPLGRRPRGQRGQVRDAVRAAAGLPGVGRAGLGERNIIAALKTYGAYVVDQGASMGIDADSTHADLWSQGRDARAMRACRSTRATGAS